MRAFCVVASATLSLTGSFADAATATKAAFTGISAPTLSTVPAMASMNSGAGVTITYDDASTVAHTLKYEPWFLSGNKVRSDTSPTGSIVPGGLINKAGVALRSAAGERQIFSDGPDGLALIAGPKRADNVIAGVSGNAVFAATNFEYVTGRYGTLPMAIGVATLDQDPVTGTLKFVKYENVDMSGVNGLWIPCAASLSPWNTFLSSEEYEPDSYYIDNFPADSRNSLYYTFITNWYSNATGAAAAPSVVTSSTLSSTVAALGKYYHYGWTPEVTVDASGKGTVVKHYAMGRFSHELAHVVADNKTVYFGDDSTNAAFFMFIADKAQDLSAGTLYAAKMTGKFNVTVGSPALSVEWINLGRATDAEVKTLADTKKLADIMDVKIVDPADTTYTKIFNIGRTEWVKVVPGMEKAAAFLETRRYAALLGASTVFSKYEGVTVNNKDKFLYAALQNVESSMITGGNGNNPAGISTLSSGLRAGVVVRQKLSASQKDSAGTAIASDWVASNMDTYVAGKDIAQDTLGNLADPNIPANPDNLKYSEFFRTLFIGEDCSQHVNCMVWAHNVDTAAQTRLLTVPAGAEATGLGAYDDLNGFIYLTASFQHAGELSTGAGKLHNNVATAVLPLIKDNYNNILSSPVGYLQSVAPTTGLPVTQMQVTYSASSAKSSLALSALPASAFSGGALTAAAAANLQTALATAASTAGCAGCTVKITRVTEKATGTCVFGCGGRRLQSVGALTIDYAVTGGAAGVAAAAGAPTAVFSAALTSSVSAVYSGVAVTSVAAPPAAAAASSDLNTWTAANAGGLAAGIACLAFIIGATLTYCCCVSGAKPAPPALTLTHVAKGTV